MVEHGLVKVRLHLNVDADCCFEVIVAAEADIWLYDGYESLVLTDEGVSVGC